MRMVNIRPHIHSYLVAEKGGEGLVMARGKGKKGKKPKPKGEERRTEVIRRARLFLSIYK